MRIKRILLLLINILIPVLMTFITAFCGIFLIKYFMPFIIAWIIAMAANPVVKFLEGRIKIHRKHGSILIIVFVLCLIIGILYLIVSSAFMLLGRFINLLPGLYESMSSDLTQTLSSLFARFDMIAPDKKRLLSEAASNLNSSVGTIIKNLALPTAEAAGGMVKKLPNLLVYTVVTILAAYFFTADMNNIRLKLNSMVPESALKYRKLIIRDFKRLIKGYFAAQFKIMLVVAAVLAAGFYILRIKYFAAAALFIAFLDFLPIFGTGTVLIPWAVLKLISAKYMYAFALALLYIITQALRQFIQPKLVGDSIGMPALYTLVFLYIGSRYSGIGGMIVAIPLGMLVLKALEYGAFDGIKRNVQLLIKEINEARNQM